MAVTARMYGKAALAALNGQLGNVSAATLKVALTTSAYVPNVDTHEFFSDITNEVVGTGYTAGGATLSGVASSYDAANHRAVLTCNAVTWPGASFTARYAVLYISTGTPATSRLLSWVDFGGDRVESAIDFVETFSSGALRLQV